MGTYNGQETEEERWLHLAHRQIEKKIPDEGVMVAMTFFSPIPQSISQKKKTEMLTGKILPVKNPDLDRLSKFVLDTLSGIASEVDRQIVSIESEMVYSENPGTEIRIDTGKLIGMDKRNLSRET